MFPDQSFLIVSRLPPIAQNPRANENDITGSKLGFLLTQRTFGVLNANNVMTRECIDSFVTGHIDQNAPGDDGWNGRGRPFGEIGRGP